MFGLSRSGNDRAPSTRLHDNYRNSHADGYFHVQAIQEHGYNRADEYGGEGAGGVEYEPPTLSTAVAEASLVDSRPLFPLTNPIAHATVVQVPIAAVVPSAPLPRHAQSAAAGAPTTPLSSASTAPLSPALQAIPSLSAEHSSALYSRTGGCSSLTGFSEVSLAGSARPAGVGGAAAVGGEVSAGGTGSAYTGALENTSLGRWDSLIEHNSGGVERKRVSYDSPISQPEHSLAATSASRPTSSAVSAPSLPQLNQSSMMAPQRQR